MEISRRVGKERTGKQCRERWLYHLNPALNHGEWSLEEEQLIARMLKESGNRWSFISKHLVGRSDNCVKNHFYSTLRRTLRWINKAINSIPCKQRKARPIKDSLISKLVTRLKVDSPFQPEFQRLSELMDDIKHGIYHTGILKLHELISEEEFCKFAVEVSEKAMLFWSRPHQQVLQAVREQEG